MDWKEIAGMPGTFVSPLTCHADERGSLTELMRLDSVPAAAEPLKPARMGWQSNMAYMSWTEEGMVRGPHEHREQWDYFLFPGPGVFELSLWDNSPSDVPDNVPGYRYCRLLVGDPTYSHAVPTAVIVPPGVVHGYHCVQGNADGAGAGLVINMPSHLFKGWDMKDVIDEIRHEANPHSPFKIPMRAELGDRDAPELIPPIKEAAIAAALKEAEKVKIAILVNGDEIELVTEIPVGQVAGFKEGVHEGAGFFGGDARAMTLEDVEQELEDGELREDLGAELKKEFA